MSKKPLRELTDLESLSKSHLDRREFLKWQLRSALLVGAGAAVLTFPESLLGSPKADIGVARGSPAAATRAAVDLIGGIRSVVKPGAKVVIKPNMSFPGGPEKACSTHPLVTKEVVAMCLEAGASRIRVLDHPTEYHASAQVLVKDTKKALEVFKKEMVFPLTKRDFYRSAPIAEGLKFKETEVMVDVLEADVLIAVPVAKCHWCTGVTGAMKGMMGLIWNRETMHRDFDLDDAVVDLASLLKADLTVIDATRVLSTNGPAGPGKVIRADTVIASRDMVAADAKMAQMFEWYGKRFEPRQVRHILMAHQRGLGRMDIENLKTREIDAR